MRNKGFTLLELSIVIVIIGLIVAGISAGQSLVRQANFRTVITDFQQMQVAVNSFKLAYSALPGDMTNAQDYWSSCVDNGSNTCNGDGDGRIEYYQTPGPRYEGWRAHQHLLLADLWKQSLSSPGIRAPGCMLHQSCIGQNVPAGPFQGSGYTLAGGFGLDPSSSKWNVYLGAINTTVGGWATSANFFTNSDVSSVDNKMDDGLPRQGLIQSGSWPSADCTSQTEYDLDNSSENCSIRYMPN